MTMSAWIAVAVFVGAYVLLATERVHRVAAALGAAGLLLALGVVTSDEAFYSRDTGIDWDVLALLLGMMVVVGVIRRTGVFEYVAIRAAKAARGRPYRLLVLLVLTTAVTSALLDNVTTVLLMAPVTALVCDRMGLPVAPFLVAEALASNIGGAATLVGDPPNIIVGLRAGLTFNDFLVHLAPVVVVVLLVFVVAARWLFRGALRGGDPSRTAGLLALDEREAITDRRLLVSSMVVLSAIVVGFVLQRQIGLSPSVVALTGAGVLVLLTPGRPADLLQDVEWETLAFFLGLFVVIGALVQVGVLDRLARAIGDATGGDVALTLVVVLVASAVLSAIVDNIPYVAAMTPVVASLIAQYPALGAQGALWWALLLGADLGGNATAIGASANVVVVGQAARYGSPISFVSWLRYGLPTVGLSLAICVPYVLIRYA